MATTKILITGGTGYIGGSVLDTIVRAHPEYAVTALLRGTPPAGFAERYPAVRVVRGDYDSADVLAEQAGLVDIVVHCGDSDHEPSLRALISGLVPTTTTTTSSPKFLIHLSGTGILADHADPDFRAGKLNPRIYSDVASLGFIQSLPDGRLHRNTEKLLNEAAAAHGGDDGLRVAIVCPPDIYGRGKGLARTASAYVPMFVRAALDLEKGAAVFCAGKGENVKSWVHVDDLMRLYLHLVEAAAAGGAGADWNEQGYYFASTQEHSHWDVAAATGRILKEHGVIEHADPVLLSADEIRATASHPRFPDLATYLFTSNSRSRSDRAKKLFGYEGTAPGLMEVLEQDVLTAVAELKK